MKKTNKFLSIILAILMVISIIPITASAEELITSGTCGENLTWSYDIYTAILTISGTGDMYDYDETNRPWEIFVGYIEKVIITDGVTSIGENAFRKITTLKHVEIGNDVTVINEFAFYCCYKIDTVIIGSGVTQICECAFGACNSLDYIYYMGTEAEYNKIDWYERTEDEYFLIWFRVEYIFVKDIETDSGKCGKNLTWIYDVPSSTLTISGTGDMDDYNYDKLPPWYQWRFFIKNVVMEEGITKIGKESFNGCDKLESAIIPDGVKIINNGAFGNCHSLKNITIPDSVTTINKSAFSSCHNLTSVVIGSGVTDIGERAFASCDSVIEYTVDNDNQYFSTDEYGVLFNKDKTFLIQYTNGNTRTAYSIPDTVISIGYMSFKNAKNLTDVTFGKSVTTIDKAAFERCSNLSSVTIPKSLTLVDFAAFDECFNIKNVYYWGTENEWYNMNVSRANEPLLNATIHYNYGKSFTGIKDDYFYKDDVKQKAYQLVEFDGNFYFINDYNKIAKNKRIYLSQRFVDGFTYEDGTPLAVGYYEFDADGKMIIRNGVVGDYFYKNNVRQNAYQLVEFDGDFYFINDSHKLAKNKTLYLSDRFVNGFTYEDGTPLQPGYYTFDENGKMVILNGPVGDYFYENNVRLKAYQLVEFEGEIYFVYDAHKLAKNKKLYLSQRFVEGTDLEVGWYEFDADGKLIIE